MHHFFHSVLCRYSHGIDFCLLTLCGYSLRDCPSWRNRNKGVYDRLFFVFSVQIRLLSSVFFRNWQPYPSHPIAGTRTTVHTPSCDLSFLEGRGGLSQGFGQQVRNANESQRRIKSAISRWIASFWLRVTTSPARGGVRTSDPD